MNLKNMNNLPMVSVCCITYNHENYIAQAIEGYLMQKTNFPIEIIIHDDASTDNTTQIVRQYAEKFPGLIVPIYQTENQYSHREGSMLFRFVFPKASGKYIAICEGDDYWTDPYKLQKQVDFLEANPDYGLVYTIVRLFDQQRNRYLKKVFGKPFKSFESLFFSIGIPTLTTLLRRSLLKEYCSDILPYTSCWKMEDYPIWLYVAHQSKLYLIEDITGTYRILLNSASHSEKMDSNLIFIKSVHDIKNFFSAKYGISQDVINKYTLMYYLNALYLAYICNDIELIDSARVYLKKNNYHLLSLFLILFDFNKNYKILMRIINKLMQIYAKYSGILQD